MIDHKLDEETTYRLFKLLEEQPELSQRELAEKMGVSLGKLNYCLKAFRDIGWVKMGNFARSKHKLKYAYILTPPGLSEKIQVTMRFLQRKQSEYEAIKREINALQSEVEGLVK